MCRWDDDSWDLEPRKERRKPKKRMYVAFEESYDRGELTNQEIRTALEAANLTPDQVRIRLVRKPWPRPGKLIGILIRYKVHKLSEAELATLLSILEERYDLEGFEPPVTEPPDIIDQDPGVLVIMVDADGNPILDADGNTQFETPEAQAKRLAAELVSGSAFLVLVVDADGNPILDANGNYQFETVPEAAARLGISEADVIANAEANGLFIVVATDALGNVIYGTDGNVVLEPVFVSAARLGITNDEVLSKTTRVVVQVDVDGNIITWATSDGVVGSDNIVVVVDANGDPILDAYGNVQYETVAEAAARLGITEAEVIAAAEANGTLLIVALDAQGNIIYDKFGNPTFETAAEAAERLGITIEAAIAQADSVISSPGSVFYESLVDAADRLLNISEPELLANLFTPSLIDAATLGDTSQYTITVASKAAIASQGYRSGYLLSQFTLATKGGEVLAYPKYYGDVTAIPPIYDKLRIDIKFEAMANPSLGSPLVFQHQGPYVFPKDGLQLTALDGEVLPVTLLNNLVFNPRIELFPGSSMETFYYYLSAFITSAGEAYLSYRYGDALLPDVPETSYDIAVADPSRRL